MKKLFVSVLAIAGLVACNTDEVVREKLNDAISFDTFVENATRADNVSTTAATLEEFSVWAYMTNETGIVFNDELVSKNGDAWSYTNTQYWLPGNAYSFAAFAGNRNDVEGLPVDAAMAGNGLGTITFTNVEGANDILYAQNYVESADADQAPVLFQFDHLLSKVRFTFANGFANENNTIKVLNIAMTSAEKATLDLSTESFAFVADAAYAWENHEGTKTLYFGNMGNGDKLGIGKKEISDEDRLVIPAGEDYEYVVTFTVEVYNGAVKGLTKDMTVTMSGLDLVAGHAYNFIATINQENLHLNAIEFQVEVDEWDEHEFDGGAVQDEVKFVSTAEELQAALDANIPHICLGANIEGDVTIEQKPGVHVAINGNGFEFMGTMTVDGKSSTATDKSLVIRDVKFVTDKTKMDFISSSNDPVRYARNITIENCTFTAPKDSDVVAMRLRQSYNIVVKGCTMNGGHSLAQITSNNSGITFENCTVESGRGINLGNAINNGAANVINCNIKATKEDGYGVRIDAKGAETLNVVGGTIEAYEPIVLRNAQSAFTFNIEGTELISKGKYQIIVLGELPTLNGVENYVVCAPVSAVGAFAAALANENVKAVDVTAELNNGTASFYVNHDVTLNMNGNKIQAGGTANSKNYGFIITDAEVAVNDANITGGGFAVSGKLVFNTGSLNVNYSGTSRYAFYLAPGAEVVINDGNFIMSRTSCPYMYIPTGAKATINGGRFVEKPLANAANKDMLFVVDGGELIITGGEFQKDPSAWVAEGYKAVNNGSTWTVVAE